MVKAQTIEDFTSAPIGRFFRGRTFAYFYPSREFNGFAMWGCPTSDDIRALNRLMDVVLTPPGGPHLSLVDASGLTSVDPAAFATMASYLVERWDAFRGIVMKQALVRPAGLAGAVVAGFYEVLSAPYPTAVFTETEAALQWLGVQNPVTAESFLTTVQRDEGGFDPLLQRLQCLLEEARSKRLALEQAAATLGVSERTLQRRLRAAQTSFQLEMHRAQVRVAQQLMLSTNANLTTIALEVGCASSQHFSTLFRKVIGQPPRDWRADMQLGARLS